MWEVLWLAIGGLIVAVVVLFFKMRAQAARRVIDPYWRTRILTEAAPFLDDDVVEYLGSASPEVIGGLRPYVSSAP